MVDTVIQINLMASVQWVQNHYRGNKNDPNLSLTYKEIHYDCIFLCPDKSLTVVKRKVQPSVNFPWKCLYYVSG